MKGFLSVPTHIQKSFRPVPFVLWSRSDKDEDTASQCREIPTTGTVEYGFRPDVIRARARKIRLGLRPCPNRRLAAIGVLRLGRLKG